MLYNRMTCSAKQIERGKFILLSPFYILHSSECSCDSWVALCPPGCMSVSILYVACCMSCHLKSLCISCISCHVILPLSHFLISHLIVASSWIISYARCSSSMLDARTGMLVCFYASTRYSMLVFWWKGFFKFKILLVPLKGGLYRSKAEKGWEGEKVRRWEGEWVRGSIGTRWRDGLSYMTIVTANWDRDTDTDTDRDTERERERERECDAVGVSVRWRFAIVKGFGVTSTTIRTMLSTLHTRKHGHMPNA
jgi:hypothetical protein